MSRRTSAAAAALAVILALVPLCWWSGVRRVYARFR